MCGCQRWDREREKTRKMKPRPPGHSKKVTGLFEWSHSPLLPSELAVHVVHCSASAIAAGALRALALLTPAQRSRGPWAHCDRWCLLRQRDRSELGRGDSGLISWVSAHREP